MNLFKYFLVLVVAVSLFGGIVGCDGGCSDATSPEERTTDGE